MRPASAPVKGHHVSPSAPGRGLQTPIPASIRGLPPNGDVAEWLKAAVC